MANQQKINLLNSLKTISHLKDCHEACFSLENNTLDFHIPIGHLKADITTVLQSQHPLSTTTQPVIQQNIPKFLALKPPHTNIKNIIAVASGKGGVGKSTITFFLAHALQQMGAKCGVLDADIYGPSQSLLFDINEKPQMQDDMFIPFSRSGIEVMSIGVLANSAKAMMWRGPMISQALMQLYQKTLWHELDFLLVDLPPGTGDIALTLLQKMPLTASLLVSNPHPLAEIDVARCKNLFEQLKAPVLLDVMNMVPSSYENQDPKGFTLPFSEAYRCIEPKRHLQFIDLAHALTNQLCLLPTYTENPFDQYNVTKA
ncbi:MAG: P-loop NTPase [Pseudomonadota bacterium]|nr:P-loop NTPase [Pseudomonadota bacterium]